MAKNKIRKTAIRKVTDLQRKMEEMRAVEEQIKKDLFESIGRFIYNTWDVGDNAENAEKLEDVIESLTDIANERLNSDFELESESSQESESNDTNDSSDYLNTSQTENTPI
ncbi:hypothetical protein P8822_00020 [Bacillus sonorensis]|uniref:hypothetical protein n=1 Tax=Bacillus sonorensis TaxID=119858 RepID=UPI002DB9827D|nr:hypothetical protein [Bacillus sonorensis]MEC0526199.1 hypothetical protein [Bacillus sonorensis]